MWQSVGLVASPLKHLAFRVQASFHRTTRPRVAIICGSEILMIRNWGDRQWSLPGGGLHSGETSKHGAVRECLEEIGVTVPESELRYITTLRHKWYDAPVYAWKASTKPTLKLQKLEITGSLWATRGSLPPLDGSLHDVVTKLDF